jgi:hypothetical protein
MKNDNKCYKNTIKDINFNILKFVFYSSKVLKMSFLTQILK